VPDPAPTEPRNSIGSASSWALVGLAVFSLWAQWPGKKATPDETAAMRAELHEMRESLAAMRVKIDNAVRDPKRPPPKEAK